MTVQVLSLLVGTVLPLIVGVVTTKTTHARTKAFLLAGLSALSGFLTEYIAAVSTAQHFDWGTVGLTALATFLTAVGVHMGLLKPAGVSEYVQDNVGRTDQTAAGR